MLGEQGRKTRILLATLLMGGCLATAQEIEVRSGFVEDSLLIGQDVSYWISATYPAHLELAFPDSNYNFSPYELSSKRYYETQLLGDNMAYDSTVYLLQSFEIDPIQYLSLPAALLIGADSTIVESPKDSIILTELAPIVTDSTKLKTNLAYQEVDRAFNYPLMYYILGGLLLLIVVLLLIFGKRILRYFKLRKLRKEYESFNAQFTELVRSLRQSPLAEPAEKALTIWKKYQQRLDKLPFSSYTTKDILALDYTQELTNPLQSIDRLVYGKRASDKVYQDFEQLEDFAQHQYSKKVEEIKNGQ